MTTTAFSLLSVEMKLTAVERALVLKLLSATPIAITGQETMVPLADLCASIGFPTEKLGRMEKQQAIEKTTNLLRDLAKKAKTINTSTTEGEESWAGFPLLHHVAQTNDPHFLLYALSPEFIGVLEGLKSARNLDNLY